ncbi:MULTISPECIES: flagellar hook assembly protein FlgD [Legionella]|uniref:Basal-body rod modification protein FlgD n=1 Tax=Legionella maceachernii TaxID=466 RepID=A0A0W0W0H1_9GAMM|nr:flagellar hook capping FlgD N-terminal domain-containing protein [Legionella maceachernii]KTD25832.1 flagellar basal body rod modification protein [Legionella maceachernii]SJZ46533.1 flagellar basal-body rod modification protein FlgD [Legionella maceachernii]SUP03991.1 flagellar basal body rod modification protein [Legionella maceachernii]
MTNAINSAQEMNINQADYLKLFMQELTYQDPLKPIDNKEFMAQMAQFSSLQEAQTTNQLLASLADNNQSLMLLGKKVTISNSKLEGVVNKIEFSPNLPPLVHVLMSNGDNPRVQLTEITLVRNSATQ